MPKAHIVQSAVFGDIEICRSEDGHQWISGSCEHRGESIEILFVCDDEPIFLELLPDAEEFWGKRVQHFKTFQEHAASNLLDELNACLDCGQTDPPQFTRAEFSEILRIPVSLAFEIKCPSSDVATCIIGGGRDSRLEHEYVEVLMGMDGVVLNAEVTVLL